jgi:hypothetical protein
MDVLGFNPSKETATDELSEREKVKIAEVVFLRKWFQRLGVTQAPFCWKLKYQYDDKPFVNRSKIQIS